MIAPLDSRGKRILIALFGERANAAGYVPERPWTMDQPLPRVTTKARELEPGVWGEVA